MIQAQDKKEFIKTRLRQQQKESGLIITVSLDKK